VPRIVTDDCEFPAGIRHARRLEKPPPFALFSSESSPERVGIERSVPGSVPAAAKHTHDCVQRRKALMR
jgi:hypothetical protein